MTPYYHDDAVTIYHGDAREIAPTLAFGAIVADPPYGMGYDPRNSSRGGNDFARIVGDDEPFDPAWLIAYDVPTVLWGGNHYASRLPDSRSWLVWDKRDGVLVNDNADCEMAWTNLGGPERIFRHVWAGMVRDSERGRTLHPTQKPVALMRWVLARIPEDAVVLDPFMGSAPVLVAAKEAGRRAIGIDIDEHWCEIAASRCSQEVLGLVAV